MLFQAALKPNVFRNCFFSDTAIFTGGRVQHHMAQWLRQRTATSFDRSLAGHPNSRIMPCDFQNRRNEGGDSSGISCPSFQDVVLE